MTNAIWRTLPGSRRWLGHNAAETLSALQVLWGDFSQGPALACPPTRMGGAGSLPGRDCCCRICYVHVAAPQGRGGTGGVVQSVDRRESGNRGAASRGDVAECGVYANGEFAHAGGGAEGDYSDDQCILDEVLSLLYCPPDFELHIELQKEVVHLYFLRFHSSEPQLGHQYPCMWRANLKSTLMHKNQ